MRGQLLTLEDVQNTLASTEPLGEYVFPVSNDVQFTLPDGWAGQDNPDAPLEGAVVRTAAGTGFQLTKNSLLEAGAACGLPRGYQERCPSDLLERQFNYWFQSGFGDKEFKLLAQGEGEERIALAMCRGTVTPFSNLRLLTAMMEAVQEKYGADTEILADYKFSHSLESTHLRLIVPGQQRNITGTSVADDTWSVGLQLKNSLIGLKQTELTGYLFRWWCTNGCIDTLASSGGFSRRTQHTEEEVYAWARDSVDNVLGGLEQTLDAVQTLTTIPVTADATMVLRDLFAQYNIPVRERDRVIANMADSDEMNMYGILNAITQTANADGLPRNAVNQLMEMGGHTAHAATGRCDADHPCRRLLPEGWTPAH